MAKTVAEACRVIEAAGHGRLTLAEVAAKVGLTPRYLHKVFKERMGCTPREYAEGLEHGRAQMGDGRVEDEDAERSAAADGQQDLQPFDLDIGFDLDALGDPEAAAAASPMDFVQWDLCTDGTTTSGDLDLGTLFDDWSLATPNGLLGFVTPSEYSSGSGSTL